MTAPSVKNIMSADAVYKPEYINENFIDLVNYIAMRNNGTFAWDNMLVSGLSVGSAAQILGITAGVVTWQDQTYIDHGTITGLGDDDHALYLLASAATNRATFATNWTDLTDAGATTLHKHDHGAMDGLSDDDHSLYLLASDATSRVAFASNWTDLTDGNGTTLHTHSYLPLSGGDITGDVSLATTKKLSLNVGDTTYLTESSAGVLDVYAASVLTLRLNTTFAANWTDLTDTGATSLHKHDHGAMDGLTDDDHTQYLLADGTRAVSGNLIVNDTKKIYLDSGSDSYLVHDSSNIIDLYTGGTLALRFNASQDVYTYAYADYSGTSTVVGFSSFTIKSIYYKAIGKLLFVSFDLRGTSDSATTSFTLPYTSANTVATYVAIGFGMDNSVVLICSTASVAANASTVVVQKDYSATPWTALGSKAVIGQLVLQIA